MNVLLFTFYAPNCDTAKRRPLFISRLNLRAGSSGANEVETEICEIVFMRPNINDVQVGVFLMPRFRAAVSI